MSTRRTRTALLALLAAAALVLSGCMDVSNDVTLDADGSGKVEISLLFSEQMMAMMAMEHGGDIDAAIEELRSEMEADSEVPEDVEFVFEEREGGLYMGATASFDTPSELEELLTSGGEEAMFSSFSLVEHGDSWELTAAADTSGFDTSLSGEDLGGSEEMDIDVDAFAELLGGKPTVEFSMTFPGKVTDSNATTVDGTTATWDLLAGDGEINATANKAGSSSSIVIVAIIGFAALVAAAVAVPLLVARNKRAAATRGGHVDGDTVAPPDSAPVPAGWYPDPSGRGGQRYWDGVAWTEHLGPPERPRH